MRNGANLVSPVMTEIIRNGVIAITEEMKTNLMRTAYNRIIYEGLDFTVGLFTATGDAVSIALGLPMFVRGMADTVKAKIKHFADEGIDPGDILVTNDANVTGAHLNHMTLTVPIFLAGELIGFASAMGHWQDIGGVLNCVTTDIYSEGLQVPILKAQSRGRPNKDLVDIIRLNVRHPDRAMGDWRAQLTAIATGERRFIELVERYGRNNVLAAIAQIFDQSEAVARGGVRSIPDGVYEAESFMDDDGIDLGKSVPMRVKVRVSGDAMTIDLSEVGAAVKGFFNSGVSTGRGCAQLAFKCLTSPSDYPINDGSFRPLDIVLPPGRSISAKPPAAMSSWMTYAMTVTDTIIKALAPAIPERVIAGHHADLNTTNVNWTRDGLQQTSYVSTSGGWGAKYNEDGMSNTVCINDGDTQRAPVEQLESKNPFLVEKFELAPDTGGAGRQRGGLGTTHAVQVLVDMNVNFKADRHRCPPWGLEGGEPGGSNSVFLRRNGETKMIEGGAKLLGVPLKRGETFIVRTGGGGGFGPAIDRPFEAVLSDVRQGYVTLEAARKIYGVVTDPRTGALDPAASIALRDRIRNLRTAAADTPRPNRTERSMP